MSAQIPLPFGNFDRYTFDLYIAGPNQHVVDNLREINNPTGASFLYIWGSTGTGKSHLLQAVCGEGTSQKSKMAYVPMSEIDRMSPEILRGLENLDCVCIDDVDLIAGNEVWEEALFNLFNLLQENHKTLLATSTQSPGGIPVILQDLKSRLASGVTYHLKYLAEADRLSALKLRAHARGFELSKEVLDFLSRRVSRDMHSLFGWLDRLDEATLVSKKKLTVPFVKGLLEDGP